MSKVRRGSRLGAPAGLGRDGSESGCRQKRDENWKLETEGRSQPAL